MWTLLHRDNCYSRRSGQDHLASGAFWVLCYTDGPARGVVGEGQRSLPGSGRCPRECPPPGDWKDNYQEGCRRQVWHQSIPMVPAVADSQGAPSPALKARRTGVPDAPLTSDAMLGGSSWSRSFEPRDLEDKTRLMTSSAPKRSPWGGASFGLHP